MGSHSVCECMVFTHAYPPPLLTPNFPPVLQAMCPSHWTVCHQLHGRRLRCGSATKTWSCCRPSPASRPCLTTWRATPPLSSRALDFTVPRPCTSSLQTAVAPSVQMHGAGSASGRACRTWCATTRTSGALSGVWEGGSATCVTRRPPPRSRRSWRCHRHCVHLWLMCDTVPLP